MTNLIDEGRGKVLVFLHGAGVDNRLWEPQRRAFSTSYRVIIPNLPGHGDVPPSGTIEEMAEYVGAQLETRGITEYALVGLSLGGMVALEMAARWPETVTHLAMIESVPYVAKTWLGRGVMGLLITPVRFFGRRFISLMPARSLGAETADAADYLKQTLMKRKGRDNYDVLKTTLHYDGRVHLADLSVPTLVMVGAKNPSTHKRAKAMSDQISTSTFKIIPNAGHIANRDAADYVNDALHRLLAEKSAGP